MHVTCYRDHRSLCLLLFPFVLCADTDYDRAGGRPPQKGKKIYILWASVN